MNNEEIKLGIKKYNELKEQEISKICSDEEIAYEAFNSVSYHTKDSNKIYVYIGWPENRDIREPINTRLYKELETKKEKRVHPLDFLMFEREHNVIFPDGANSFGDNYFEFKREKYLEFYNHLRNEFFMQLTMEPQEKVVEKILSKTKIY